MADKQKKTMRKFGLIGKDISYSFSKGFFSEKFENENRTDCSYENFDLQDISEFETILKKIPDLKGLNVTIPYKEQVIPYLDKLNKKAKKIGAVNTIKISKKGKLTGYNTDYYGFKKSIEPFLKPHHKNALILGTGGASKAIRYALKRLNISVTYVSRLTSNTNTVTYQSLSEADITKHTIIINCTPLGTHPDISKSPDIPYQFITNKHLLYDLVYNPAETTFLQKGKAQGASICNGLLMLHLQAKKSWKIWN